MPEIFCCDDDQWPCHVAGLDHGSIGAAASQFIENCQDPDINYLHYTQFDPFHQAVRDGKNPIGKSWRGKAQDTMVQSQYVFNMNYKPYHSCEWSRHKAELLNQWLLQNDRDSPNFCKWVDRIAWVFGVPFDGSSESRKQIYEMLSVRLKSFNELGQREEDGGGGGASRVTIHSGIRDRVR